MSLLVVDGNSIANRAFFGIKVLTTKEGQYTNAIYGFMNILLSLTQNYQPDEVAIAFDLPAPTFRHKMYDGYKANRHGMPEELAAQMPLLQQLLTDLGYKLVTAEGWEADDILGTLAAACDARGETCYIATGDRDNLQLVSPNTTVLLAATSRGHSETRVMDEAAIRVGAQSNIQDNATLHTGPAKGVVVGRGVTVGHGAILHGCTVGDGCMIGMHATVLDGAQIGAGSLVAAGALVPEHTVIPPGSLVVGVPGKIRGPVRPEQAAHLAANAGDYRREAAAHAAGCAAAGCAQQDGHNG